MQNGHSRHSLSTFLLLMVDWFLKWIENIRLMKEEVEGSDW